MPTSAALKILIADKTGTDTVSRFTVEKETIPTTILATGTYAGAESANLEMSSDQGTTWIAVLGGKDVDVGIAYRLDNDHTVLVIDFPGYFRLNKEATAAGAGAVLASPRTPGSP